MPITAQIICDNCRVVETHTNHCYARSIEKNTFSIKPIRLTDGWATENFADSSFEYFCGRACAVEALTRWMNKLYAQTVRSQSHAEMILSRMG
jgi:hypothetical protein